MLFYKPPDDEGVYGAVEEVRAWVLAHRAANKRQRTAQEQLMRPYRTTI
jgi:hypothetical protein